MANVKATDLIDFTRASKGHALAKVSYGSELVENGTFDTDVSGWTTQSGGSTFTVSSGQLTISRSAVDPGYVYQIISTTAGNVYYVTFGVIDNGPIDLRVGTSPAGLQIASSGIKSSAGTYTLAFVATGASTYISLVNTSYSTDATIDNISVREVTFDQPDGTLQLFEHPVGIPRIEYDADGNLLGLLIEESRTNLLPYSEDFSNAAWSKGPSATVEDTTIVSPDGLQNAKQVEMSSTTAGVYETVPVIASTVYTFSVWIKADTAGSIRLARTNSGPDGADVDVTTEWQRFSVQITPTTSIDGPQIRRDNAGQLSKIYIYGAQLEAGSFPTSYIKTTGATATRSTDVASIPVSDFGYNQNEGTVVAEYNPFSVSGTARGVFELSSGTGSNKLHSRASVDKHWLVRSGDATQASIDLGSANEGQQNKIAGVYKLNDFAASLNGSAVSIDTIGSVPTGIEEIIIGSFFDGSNLNGHIKSIKYIPKRLSNAKLQELTS